MNRPIPLRRLDVDIFPLAIFAYELWLTGLHCFRHRFPVHPVAFISFLLLSCAFQAHALALFVGCICKLVFQAPAEAAAAACRLGGWARWEVGVVVRFRVCCFGGVMVMFVVRVEGDEVMLGGDAMEAADFGALFGWEGVHVFFVIVWVVPD
jgi:hypothetical protein